MTEKQKLDKFLKLQNKGMIIDEIAIELNSEVRPLRRFLNKHGYKSVKGKYVKKEEDNSANNIKQLELTIDSVKKADKKNVNKTKSKNTKKETQKNSNKVYKSKPAKVNVSAEDLDKLCEVYDWYLSVKDIKSLQPKTKKDINIEKCNMNNLKATRVQVEKSTWEEFERLCSNSKYSKQEIITQAIKDFLKQYKHLI
ncbi:Uncharacterised protein [uncultured Clostridium sp.]|nr:Uncharacterised protein [uncultured Clostridium sp.]SCI94915.1 Uncharacterised protein [uncultured Clostridium sp.]